MEKRRVRVGFIGSEHIHGPYVLRSVLKLPDEFEIVGWCDVRETPGGRTYEPYQTLNKMPLEQILADKSIEAVMIETAEWDSLDVAFACAEAGKHIHLDKPAGMDCAKFEKVLSLQKKNGKVLSMGYMYRSNATVRYMLDRVREGKLGTIHEVNCRMSTTHSPEDRALLNKYPGGMMYFLVCHLIDLTVTMMGVPEEIIPTVVTHTVNGLSSPDDATVLMRYKNGTSVSRACSLEIAGFSRRECSVCGDRGTIEVRPLEEPALLRETYADYKMRGGECYWNNVFIPQYTDRYVQMMTDYASMVRGELVNPYSYEYEARLQRIVLAACGMNVDWKAEIKL